MKPPSYGWFCCCEKGLAMTNLERLKHWYRVTFQGACPDPECHGHMIQYDYNPDRDTCSECGRAERDFKREETKKRLVL